MLFFSNRLKKYIFIEKCNCEVKLGNCKNTLNFFKIICLLKIIIKPYIPTTCKDIFEYIINHFLLSVFKIEKYFDCSVNFN